MQIKLFSILLIIFSFFIINVTFSQYDLFNLPSLTKTGLKENTEPTKKSVNKTEPTKKSVNKTEPTKKSVNKTEPMKKPVNKTEPMKKSVNKTEPMNQPTNNNESMKQPDSNSFGKSDKEEKIIISCNGEQITEVKKGFGEVIVSKKVGKFGWYFELKEINNYGIFDINVDVGVKCGYKGKYYYINAKACKDLGFDIGSNPEDMECKKIINGKEKKIKISNTAEDNESKKKQKKIDACNNKQQMSCESDYSVETCTHTDGDRFITKKACQAGCNLSSGYCNPKQASESSDSGPIGNITCTDGVCN